MRNIISMTLATFSSSGTIPRELDKIKCVNGSRYESVHCFRIDAGSSSLPEAEFVIADMIVLTSSIYIYLEYKYYSQDFQYNVVGQFLSVCFSQRASNINKVVVKSVGNHFSVRDILIIYEENNIFCRASIILLINYAFNNVP